MYARHDGTRSYFFNIEEMKELAAETGLEIENISYCERMTVNKKENVEAKRLFLQARFLDTIQLLLSPGSTDGSISIFNKSPEIFIQQHL